MKDRLVTLFGGGGFVGRYVAQELLRRGGRVRIAQRDPKQAFFIKPLGGLGQVQYVAADIEKPESVARAVAGADAAVNLVGILKGDFAGIHQDGAANVARACAAAGVVSLVHISAIGAAADSPSAYGRSKAAGEAAVLDAFPDATILRPSIIFGPEDGFINRFAGLIRALPVVPVIAPNTKLQPVHVVDVARAVAVAIDTPSAAGQSFELGGPDVLTMLEVNAWIAKAIGRERLLLSVPAPAAAALAMVPGGPITGDQWKMLQKDNVVAPDARTIDDLGIAPTPLAAVAENWLVQYRNHGRFADRVKA